MRFENTKDILNHISHFHDILSEYYHQISTETDSKRLKLLLDYLSDRETKIKNIINQYSDVASHKILDNWFQYSLCSDKMIELKRIMDSKILEVEKIVDLVVQFDDCFINMLKEIANNADNEATRELFINLIELEENEKKHVSLTSHRLNDL